MADVASISSTQQSSFDARHPEDLLRDSLEREGSYRRDSNDRRDSDLSSKQAFSQRQDSHGTTGTFRTVETTGTAETARTAGAHQSQRTSDAYSVLTDDGSLLASMAQSMVDFPALRILEPARKKLVTIDTQRIMWSLDESIRQCEIITALMLVVIPNQHLMDELQPTLGIELYNALATYKALYQEFEVVLNNENEEDEEIPILEGKMCEACKDLLRLFVAHPAAVTTCVKLIPKNISIAGGRKFHQPKKLIQGLVDLRNQMFARLLTTPIESKERYRYLKKVGENEQSNNVMIAKLEVQLEASIKDKEEEIARKNEEIRKFKSDLHQIEQFSTEHIKQTKRESERQKRLDNVDNEDKLERLNHDYDQASSIFDKMLQEHRDIEMKLRKRKYKIETEVDNWIVKYDVEMNEKQDEIDQIELVYAEEKKQLNELQEKFAVLSEEYETIMDERRVARQKKETEENDTNERREAATTIQAYFRAYRVRKVLKAKEKKNRKKKGKKKK